MKRINITLPDDLADRIEETAKKKEMSVAEFARRGLELYLQRFPGQIMGNSRLPVFDLGKPKVVDSKEVIYRRRIAHIAD